MSKRKNRTPVEEVGGELVVESRNDAGEEVDTSVIQETGMGFDPGQMHMDLTKDEKRRTTALVLAIQAYDKLIIKDAEYLREAHSQAARTGAVIRPATMDAMVVAALQFDAFISGRLGQPTGIQRGSQPLEPSPSADAVDPVGETVTG